MRLTSKCTFLIVRLIEALDISQQWQLDINRTETVDFQLSLIVFGSKLSNTLSSKKKLTSKLTLFHQKIILDLPVL